MLHSFSGTAGDGANPASGLVIGKGGVLYGTTTLGGSLGAGIVFSLTPPSTPGNPWTEAVLDDFVLSNDGSAPAAPLLLTKTGLLYGTTSFGGTLGWGTVFELKPPAMPGGAWQETTSQMAPTGPSLAAL